MAGIIAGLVGPVILELQGTARPGARPVTQRSSPRVISQGQGETLRVAQRSRGDLLECLNVRDGHGSTVVQIFYKLGDDAPLSQ